MLLENAFAMRRRLCAAIPEVGAKRCLEHSGFPRAQEREGAL
jgi:hypothetical protein